MDYKFVILLLVIVGLILFFTREVENIKYEINKKLDDIVVCIDNTSKSTVGKMQYNLGTCVNKLKTINGDYLEQVRKMNDYGSQPITVLSNNYTDTDSQGGTCMKFASLSECKQNALKQNQHASKKELSELYISEDGTDEFKINYCKSNNKSEHSDKNENLKHSEQIKPQIKHLEQPKPQIQHNTKYKEFIISPELIDEENDHITTETDTNESIKEFNFENDINNEENNSNDDSDNESDDSDGVFIEIDNSISKKQNNSIKSKSSVDSSNFGSITFGSSKKKVNYENDSVSTNNLEISSIDNLKSIETYTMNSLKKIAKQMSIPFTLKDGKNRRNLKKTELYDKIKNHLINK